jgi:hypothetical protein
LQQAGDEDIHHEAEVEHAGAKHLIDQIESAAPGDDYFDAEVSVLSEMIKHHVRQEEKPGGMFAEARKATMDWQRLAHNWPHARRNSKRKANVAGRMCRATRRSIPLYS